MDDRKALARFASEMAAALTRLADALREPVSQPARVAVSGEELVSMLPGHRQRAVFEYLKSVGGKPQLTREVNDGIGYDCSNTYTTLQRLKQLGVVEMLPGIRPQQWRLAQPFRDGKR